MEKNNNLSSQGSERREELSIYGDNEGGIYPLENTDSALAALELLVREQERKMIFGRILLIWSSLWISVNALTTESSISHNLAEKKLSKSSELPLRQVFQKYYKGGENVLLTDILARLEWSELSFTDKLNHFPVHHVNYSQFNALGSVIQCPKELLHSYGEGDGEKRVCGDISSVESENNCVIISLGSYNQWDFENAIIAKHPKCKIHTFDCYTQGIVPKNLVGSVTSHNICIGPKDELIGGHQFLTWVSILKKVDVQTAPTALKMDIEGFEWLVLREMMRSSPLSLLPHSISFEIHSRTSIQSVPWYGRNRNLGEVGLFMDYLMKFGYVLVDRHDNPFCKSCSEVVIGRIGDCGIRKD